MCALKFMTLSLSFTHIYITINTVFFFSSAFNTWQSIYLSSRQLVSPFSMPVCLSQKE